MLADLRFHCDLSYILSLDERIATSISKPLTLLFLCMWCVEDDKAIQIARKISNIKIIHVFLDFNFKKDSEFTKSSLVMVVNDY